VMETGVAVGGAVETWRCGMVRVVNLVACRREGLIELLCSRE
jgi:hypothetical protein